MSLPSGLPEQIGSDEPISRFLTSSGHHNASAVRPAAFMPNWKNGETSVFRHGAEPLEILKAIGKDELESRGAKVRGAAVISAADVSDVGLELAAKEPPPRHADIVGWSWSEDDKEFGKAKQKEMAALLAQRATLLRY